MLLRPQAKYSPCSWPDTVKKAGRLKKSCQGEHTHTQRHTDKQGMDEDTQCTRGYSEVFVQHQLLEGQAAN